MMSLRRLSQCILSLGAILSTSAPAFAAVIELGPTDDVEAAINAAQPGDEIVLRGGTYTLTQRFGISVSGTAQAPIVLRAKDGEKPVLHRPLADQNVIDIDNGEYLMFRGLEISGGSHGLRFVQARFITVENCEIHDTDDVALSANSGGEYQGFRILRNHIHHTNNTGEGMYLGCNNNGCRFFDGLIEGNYIHHTNGPTVVQGDGIEIKEGSYNNIVRDNVIHDTNYPCILTYSTVGNGGPNIIERNLMWNCGDHGIQSAADAIIRNNVILGSAADGLAMQPHQAGVPSNLVVVHNTILHPGNDAISISGVAGPILIANNALYAQSGNALGANGDLSQLTVTGNVGQGGLSGPSMGLDASGNITSDFVAASFSGVLPNDVFPMAGSKLIGAGDSAHVTSDDFNGTLRGGVADVGAYKYDPAGNPGWTFGEGFKDVTPSSGGAGGAGGGSGGATGSGGSATGGSGTGSGGTSAGGGSAADSGDAGGCGCRLASESGAPSALFGLLLLLALGRRRA